MITNTTPNAGNSLVTFWLVGLIAARDAGNSDFLRLAEQQLHEAGIRVEFISDLDATPTVITTEATDAR